MGGRWAQRQGGRGGLCEKRGGGGALGCRTPVPRPARPSVGREQGRIPGRQSRVADACGPAEPSGAQKRRGPSRWSGGATRHGAGAESKSARRRRHRDAAGCAPRVRS
eukprot:scaffold269_cov123-Isochrysis_galbana.AAC.2